MNTDNFLIDNSDIEMAQNICKMITNTEVRNRAVANAIAGSIAAKFFDTEKYDVDSESGLHNIGTVLEDIDISDIYINGNYFDARVFFNEEEMSIPAAHFKNNLLPTAYMFIKINADLSGATVIGFVNPENVKMMNSVDGYENFLQSLISISPVKVVFDNIESGAKGIYYPNEEKIVVQTGMSNLQTLKTLVHESAHARLHNNQAMEKTKKNRETEEVEALYSAFQNVNHFKEC